MEYPNSGKLTHNKYKTAGDKKPDFTGEIKMQRSALKELMEQHAEDEIVIKLSGWQMSGQWGPWLRISWNNYKKPENTEKQFFKREPDSDVPF